jgi:hypothetical protein
MEQCPAIDFPFESDPSQDTPPELAKARLECPVVRVRVQGGKEAWLITRYEDLKLVTTDYSRFSRADATKPGATSIGMSAARGFMFSMDPPEHTRIRRLKDRRHPARGVRQWHSPLPRCQPRPDGAAGGDRHADSAPPQAAARRAGVCAGVEEGDPVAGRSRSACRLEIKRQPTAGCRVMRRQ